MEDLLLSAAAVDAVGLLLCAGGAVAACFCCMAAAASPEAGYRQGIRSCLDVEGQKIKSFEPVAAEAITPPGLLWPYKDKMKSISLSSVTVLCDVLAYDGGKLWSWRKMKGKGKPLPTDLKVVAQKKCSDNKTR